MGSNGGSITLRMAVAGSAEVRAALASLGPAGRQALQQIEQATHQPNAALRALNVVVTDGKEKIHEFAGEAGTAGRALQALGPGGLAVAAGLGVAIAAVDRFAEGAKEAGNWAEDLVLHARAVGQTTTQLQEYREAGEQFRIENAAMDEALTNLNVTFSKLRSGVQDVKIKKVLTDLLHIDPQDLKSIPDATAFLLQLADAIHDTQDTASRLQIVRAFGIEALLPLLEGGSQRIRTLLKDTHQFGEVLDKDMVQQMAAANQELREQEQRTDASSRKLHGVLIPALVEFKREVAEINEGLAELVGWMNRAFAGPKNNTDALVQTRQALLSKLNKNNQQLLDPSGIFNKDVVGKENAAIQSALGHVDQLMQVQARMGQQLDAARKKADDDARKKQAELAAQAAAAGGGRGGRSRAASGSGAAGGPSPEDVAAQQQMLALQLQLNVARAGGDALMTKALEDRIELLEKVKELEGAHYSHDQAVIIANGYMAEKQAAEQAHAAAEKLTKEFEDSRKSFADLVQGISNGLEKTREEEQKTADDRARSSANGISNVLQALYRGDASSLVDNFLNKMFDSIGQQLTAVLPGSIQSLLGQAFGDAPLTTASASAAAAVGGLAAAATTASAALNALSASGGGGGGALSQVAAAVIHGHADGTAWFPGGWSAVNEEGTELVRLPRGSKIFKHADTMAMLQDRARSAAPMMMVAAPNGVRMGPWGASGGDRPTVLNNYGPSPLRAEEKIGPDGARSINLYDAVGKGFIRSAGASGDLGRAIRRMPASKRRGM